MNQRFINELIEIEKNARGMSEELKQCRKRIMLRRVGAISRCYNPKEHNYKEYGARGIRVCKSWRDDIKPYVRWFVNQLARFANDYPNVTTALDCLEVDRINRDGNYTPNNCRLLDKNLNPYTTGEASRCAMYNDKWTPMWYIEKLIGYKRIGAGFDKSRGKWDISKGLSDRISAHLNHAKKRDRHDFYGFNTPFMLCTSKANWKYSELTPESILELTKGLVYYDFRKNPLHFFDCVAKCPLCQNNSVTLIKDKFLHKEGFYARCECGFSEIVIHNVNANRNRIDKEDTCDLRILRSLPLLKTNEVEDYVFNDFKSSDEIKAKEAEQQKSKNYLKDKRYSATPKGEVVKARYLAKRQILKNDITIKADGRTNIAKKGKLEKIDILKLQTRNAIRKRLKKEGDSLPPKIVAKARERMRLLLRKEKADAKKRNPAGYYARLKRMNDNRIKRERGDDYVIKPKTKSRLGTTPLYITHAETKAMPRKKRKYDVEYFTLKELEDLGLNIINKSEKKATLLLPKKKAVESLKDFTIDISRIYDRQKENDLVNAFLKKQDDKSFAINYQGTPIVWEDKTQYTFCKCKKGVIKLDFENECTTACTECGFKVGFDGKEIIDNAKLQLKRMES